MSRIFVRSVVAAALFASVILPAYAKESLGIVTGPKPGTYFAFGRDMSKIAARSGITIDLKSSEGSIDNIKRINSSENAALGIVQSDVLGFLSRSQSPESIRVAEHLRMIFPLYNEEVHVLAHNSIQSFSDLNGKKVAVGEDGSGNMLTSINLFSMMGVSPAEMSKISPANGIVEVLKGNLDAAIFVGGKPVRMFKNMEDLTLPENQKYALMLQRVHFIPMNAPEMLKEYRSATITKADYNFVREDVPTIAVQSVLVSYDFMDSKNKKRCDLLKRFALSVRNNLHNLRKKGHPKWKEVRLEDNTGIWKKDQCAWPSSPKKSEKYDN